MLGVVIEVHLQLRILACQGGHNCECKFYIAPGCQPGKFKVQIVVIHLGEIKTLGRDAFGDNLVMSQYAILRVEGGDEDNAGITPNVHTVIHSAPKGVGVEFLYTEDMEYIGFVRDLECVFILHSYAVIVNIIVFPSAKKRHIFVKF